MIAQIQGNIITQKIKSPSEGKPHIALQILQEHNEEAELVKVKDYNLNASYNGKFDALCRVSNWSFDGRSGLTVSVLEAETEEKADSKQTTKKAKESALL